MLAITPVANKRQHPKYRRHLGREERHSWEIPPPDACVERVVRPTRAELIARISF